MEILDVLPSILRKTNEHSSSTVTCQSPIKPREGEQVRFWKDSPAHTGPFKYAVDIIIPDPRIKTLPVFAPASGSISDIIQAYDICGSNEEFQFYTNYITVELGDGKFYQLCHIGKNSAMNRESEPLKIGDSVKRGEQIATTGANGWMTDVRHIHFMVGRWIDRNNGVFESLRIKFDDAPNPY